MTKSFLPVSILFFLSTALSQKPVFTSLQGMPSPAAASSSAPFLFKDRTGEIFLSWVESEGNKRSAFKFSQLQGEGWSEPRTIASGSDFFVNWADVPAIIRTSSGTFLAHWLRRTAGSPYAYEINVSMSADGGSRWSKGVKPHRDTAKTEHGFVSFFEMNKTTGLVWLDGRNMSAEESGHGDHGGGNMTLRTAMIENGVPGSELELDNRVCECCPTAATATPNALIVAYRNRSEDEVRDIQVVRMVKGKWQRPRIVREDGWQIPGCPVNGPALSSNERNVAIAWFTAADGNARVFVSFSDDEGESFGPEVRVDDGKPLGRIALSMLPDTSAIVLWIEYREGRGELLARRIWSSGKISGVAKVADVSVERASGNPRVAVVRGRLIATWTDAGSGRSVKVATGILR